MSDSEPLTLTILIEEENGMLFGEVKELPGCFASGEDMDHLLEAASEAIGMYLEDPRLEAEAKVLPLRRLVEKKAKNQLRHISPRELELVYEA